MRLFEFKISDKYIASLATQGKMTEYIELWGTPWFDLNGRAQRRSVAQSIVALVARQTALR